MKIYEITIKPQSNFGTPLKGDTIFGHFCWQIAYDSKVVGKNLDDLLSNYSQNPFVIFSSAYPKFFSEGKYHYALKTPDIPMNMAFELPSNKEEIIKKRKEYKAKKWMIIKEGEKIKTVKEVKKYRDSELFLLLASKAIGNAKKQMKDSEAKNPIANLNQFHNKINRLTGKTGIEGFAPFSVEQYSFLPNMELAIFVGFDEKTISIEQILKFLERIGDFGYGKDSSIGLGKFILGEETEVDLNKMGSENPNGCYVLSPFVPEKNTYSQIYFSPFTRFGKHGDKLSKSNNPFKKPVIMADEGAVAIPKNKELFEKKHIGTAITTISLCEPKTVAQGYSLYIPVNLEG